MRLVGPCTDLRRGTNGHDSYGTLRCDHDVFLII